MRYRLSVILGLALMTLLAGCATATASGGGPGGVGAADSGAPATTDELGADPEAEALAQAWLDGAVVPPGAVFSETKPVRFLSYFDWPCEPTVERIGYWTIEGSTVAEAANWLQQNPTGGLTVTTPGGVPEGAHEVAVGNATAPDVLEGISYTVTRTDDGVAIRAEIGVIPEGSVCPEGNWGGPGQG